jgi:hypothetical protein
MSPRLPLASVLAGLVLAAPAGAQTAPSLLPFPSNAYTVKDRGTPTGVRLNFRRAEMPRNVKGRAIDPRRTEPWRIARSRSTSRRSCGTAARPTASRPT